MRCHRHSVQYYLYIRGLILPVPQGHRLQVVDFFEGQNVFFGDLDLFLYDGAGDFVSSSESREKGQEQRAPCPDTKRSTEASVVGSSPTGPIDVGVL